MLLQYAETRFNEETTLELKMFIYNNIIFFEERLSAAVSYRIGSSYDSVGWVTEYYSTDEAKTQRAIIVSAYAQKKRQAQEFERTKRIAKYWSAHPEEKKKLEEETERINKAIDELKREYAAIPESKTVTAFRNQLKALEEQKQNLGLFKTKEKKEIQDQIDMLHLKYDPIEAEYNRKANAITQQANKYKEAMKRISEEYHKAR